MADTREKEPKQGRAADPGAEPRGEPVAERPAADVGVPARGEETPAPKPGEETPAPKPKEKQKGKESKGKKPAEAKAAAAEPEGPPPEPAPRARLLDFYERDRKSTRLNSSHSSTSYAVFCLKKKKRPPSVAMRPSLPRSSAPRRREHRSV